MSTRRMAATSSGHTPASSTVRPPAWASRRNVASTSSATTSALRTRLTRSTSSWTSCCRARRAASARCRSRSGAAPKNSSPSRSRMCTSRLGGSDGRRSRTTPSADTTSSRAASLPAFRTPQKHVGLLYTLAVEVQIGIAPAALVHAGRSQARRFERPRRHGPQRGGLVVQRAVEVEEDGGRLHRAAPPAASTSASAIAPGSACTKRMRRLAVAAP